MTEIAGTQRAGGATTSWSWFAAGVATALVVVLVATQAWSVGAAGDEDTALVPITPCRLADTRPGEFRVGDVGSLGVEDTITLQGIGEQGECVIPGDAKGLALNVTAVGATAETFLTIWPDGDLPNASSLNPAPGQPPVPNAVTTKLADDGSFRVYNFAGTVDVIVDVTGYLIVAGGPRDFEVVSASDTIDLVNPGDLSGSSVECPEGKLATGGGASITSNQGLDLKTSIPQPDLSGWSATVIAEDSPFSGTLNMYAICASGIVMAP